MPAGCLSRANRTITGVLIAPEGPGTIPLDRYSTVTSRSGKINGRPWASAGAVAINNANSVKFCRIITLLDVRLC